MKLDIAGSVLVTTGLASVIYGVVNTTTHAWTSATTVGWLLGGVVLLLGFFFWEARVASHPLVPFRMFKSRTLSTANVIMFLIGGTFFAMWYFLTYYFQYVLKYDPVKSGLAFFPMAIGIIIGAQISSRLIAKVGVRPLLKVGAGLATVGFLWLSLIKSDSSYLTHILAPSFLCSFSIGILFSPLAVSATSGVDRADSGLASGVLNTARQVGGSLALAVLATVATDVSNSALHHSSLGSALTSGYERAFLISGFITFVALLVTMVLPRHTGRGVATAAAVIE